MWQCCFIFDHSCALKFTWSVDVCSVWSFMKSQISFTTALFNCKLFTDLFQKVYLKVKGTEEEKQMISLLVCSLTAHHSQEGQARREPGARTSMKFFCGRGRDSGAWAVTCCILGTRTGGWIRGGGGTPTLTMPRPLNFNMI